MRSKLSATRVPNGSVSTETGAGSLIASPRDRRQRSSRSDLNRRRGHVAAGESGIRGAGASTVAHPDGLRLGGIAEEPPPASAASLTSACISSATSRAILPQVPARIASALATSPKLMLVDEIAAGLNPKELSWLAEWLLELSSAGIALLVVEHLIPFLKLITTRVVVMDVGSVIFEGDIASATQDDHVIEVFLGRSK